MYIGERRRLSNALVYRNLLHTSALQFVDQPLNDRAAQHLTKTRGVPRWPELTVGSSLLTVPPHLASL